MKRNTRRGDLSAFVVCCLVHCFYCCLYSRISSFGACNSNSNSNSNSNRNRNTPSIIFPLGEAAKPSPDFSPSAYSYQYRQKGRSDDVQEIDLGTTLVAIKYSGGVVVGADTRTSVGGYVSNKFAYKINPIFEPGDEFDADEDSDEDAPPRPLSSSCVLCRSGSAADTQWLAIEAKRQFRVRRLEQPGYRCSVSEVAHYLRHRIRNSNARQDSPLQASLICAGYDGGTRCGQIFGLAPGGSLWEEDHFCMSGSGSTVLYGDLDDLFDTRKKAGSLPDLSEEDATALVEKLLKLSIGRDASSGGLVRLYVIDQNGLDERTIYPFAGSPAESDSGDGNTVPNDLNGFAKSAPR